MPRGDWIWPGTFSYNIRLKHIVLSILLEFLILEAIALLPTQEVYGSWPRSGDIVMAEIRGNDNWTCPEGQMGNSVMESSLDWGFNLFENFSQNTTWLKYL